MKYTGVIWLLFTVSFISCDQKTVFKFRGADETGLTFNNQIEPLLSDTFNVLDFEYVYNGGGVGAGDLNNDGLLDLYFAGNFVSSKLYLNQGDLKFKDITEVSLTATNRWATGVAMVDINNDGLLDIYVCVGGADEISHSQRNYFFINQGIDDEGVPLFEDQAASMGLDIGGHSTMAAFFDYDLDGDLDVYLLMNAQEDYNRNNVRGKITDGSAKSNDRLFRNEGNGTFTDVSKESGILVEGWGLGVCVSDINQDGWPDVYVANDFLSNDLVWINQQDGTFEEKADEFFQVQTHNGMGVDIADYNNDLLPDIMVLDMLPESNYREKMMISGGNYDKLLMGRDFGYGDQYMRNTLQLNRGTFPDGRIKFSEIGYLSGVFRTDWSWAPLFADFDNDGFKDLFIANGYRKDVTNLDYIVYSQQTSKANMFGTEETRQKRMRESLMIEMDDLEEVKLSNYLFRNKQDLTFEDVTKDWGLDVPGFSNGSLYADLDNDGDLDIVTNNIDDAAFLFENTLRNSNQDSTHYLRIRLEDTQPTFGTKLTVYQSGFVQYFDFTPYRGYKSSVEPIIHIGTGSIDVVDSIHILWPDQASSLIRSIDSDQEMIVSKENVGSIPSNLREGPRYMDTALDSEGQFLLSKIDRSSSFVQASHQEDGYDDFKDTPMLPFQLSLLGPYAAVGDLNGDNLQDIVVGGDYGKPTVVAFQSIDSDFSTAILPGDSIYEDRGIAIFDADGDADLDIYAVSGGSRWSDNHPNNQDRLYINNGSGSFIKEDEAIPELTTSGSAVEFGDVDNDGDIDLFIGGYLIPRKYPLPPKSAILINEKGFFTDQTKLLAPALQNLGMVTDAKWGDLNNDGHLDLVVVGEWMPISLFINDGNGKLVDNTDAFGFQDLKGWYKAVELDDLDEDGFLDIIVGNVGLNNYYKVSAEGPMEVYSKDIDGTGSLDPIITHYNQGKRYISFFRDQLISQINGAKGRFQRFDDFARSTFEESFTAEEIAGAHYNKVTELSSFILKNQECSAFIRKELPVEVQFSSINDIEVHDIDKDGFKDLLLVGNTQTGDPIRGEFNASYGLILKGEGNLSFQTLPPSISGFAIEGYCQTIISFTMQESQYFLVTKNNDYPEIFRLESP